MLDNRLLVTRQPGRDPCPGMKMCRNVILILSFLFSCNRCLLYCQLHRKNLLKIHSSINATEFFNYKYKIWHLVTTMNLN